MNLPLAVASFACALLTGLPGAGDSAAPSPDGSVLQPYTNQWQFSGTKPDGTTVPVGIWTDALTRVVVDGKPAYKRIQVARFDAAKLTRTFVNVFAPESMLPLASTFTSSSGEALLRRFDGANVWQLDGTNDNLLRPVESRDVVPTAPYDFNGGMYCLLLATYPLTPGLEYSVPTVGEFKTALQRVPVRVVGQATVEGKPGTTVTAWEVDATISDGDGPPDTMHCYVTRQPPYVIKLVYEMTTAKQRFTYTMI